MTTHHAPAVQDLAPPRPAQWLAMTRLLLRDAMTYLLSATVVSAAFLLVGALLARWFGWQLVTSTDLSELGAAVRADGDGVTVFASVFLLVAAAGVAAVIVPVVLAARTRVYVAAGATRRSVAVGQLLTVTVAAVYVLALTVVVLLAAGRGVDGMIALLEAADGGEAALRLLAVAGGLLAAMVACSAVTALFLRWPWWVGTAVLLLLCLLPPVLARFALPSGWGTEFAVALVLAAAYWWLVRRVPVR